MRSLSLPVVAVMALCAADARAEGSCPFPSTSGASGSSNGSSSTSRGRSTAGDIIATVADVLVAAAEVAAEVERVRRYREPSYPVELVWPDALDVRLTSSYSTAEWGDVAFRDVTGTVEVPGALLDVASLELLGAEAALDLVIGSLRLGVGAGVWGSATRAAGGPLVDSTFGRDAVASRLTFAQLFVELGAQRRLGPFAFFGLLRTGVRMAFVHVADATCGCYGDLEAAKILLGPEVGVRAPVAGALYLQGSFQSNVLGEPELGATFGIGLGRATR